MDLKAGAKNNNNNNYYNNVPAATIVHSINARYCTTQQQSKSDFEIIMIV
jgi:hypothetical protein